MIFSWDWDYSGDEIREIARSLVEALLADEAMQQAINANVDTKYLDIVADMLSYIASLGATASTSPSTWDAQVEVLNEIMSDSKAIRSLAQATKEDGTEGFCKQLGTFVGSNAASVLININAFTESPEVTSIFAKACSKESALIKEVSSALSNWNSSVELTEQLINIAAAQEEACILLDMLIEYMPSLSNCGNAMAICTELKYIREELDNLQEELRC